MNMDTSSDWQELLLGDYEINPSMEWEYLDRVLIFLQLFTRPPPADAQFYFIKGLCYA
jgi:hypothetical protein